MIEPYHKIVELYEEIPVLKSRYNLEFHRSENPLDEDLSKIKDIQLKEYSLEELEKLYNKKDSNHYTLSKLLAFLSPKQVFENFGEETLYWTWQRYNYGIERSNKILEQYANLTNRDAKILEQSKLAEWRLYLESSTLPKDTFKLYEITTGLDTKLANINLEEKILKFSKNKKRINKILDRYSLTALTIENLNNKGGGYEKNHNQIYPETLTKEINKIQVIYLDTPIGIALNYNNIPVAITTFAIENETLQIRQIQGARETLVDKDCELIKKLRTKGLFDFNWKKTLVTITEEVAKSFEIKNTSIQKSRKVRWTHEYWKDGRVHLDLKDAIRMYDYTAKSLGYTRDKTRDNNWYKELE